MSWRPKKAVCVICGAEDARPPYGHKTPFCKKCHQDWEDSPEHRRFVTARNDFVDRRLAERANDQAG